MKKLVGFFAILMFVAGIASAQVNTGTLVGIIKDTTGAVIPHAAIELVNEGTGVHYSGASNAEGQYRIGNLPNGAYDLAATVSGFTSISIKNIAIEANNVQTRDIAVSPGQATTVEVSTEAAVAIDTTTAQISSTFTLKETQDLPTASVGLGVLNLSLLSPGVTSTGGLGAGTGPSVSGQRPRNNNFTIDGTDNNSKSVTGPLLFVPNDAVQEFTSLQNVYSAQYGHSTGGQFNSLIVSGTNSLHGRLYEYLQNRNLNAVSNLQRINNVASGKAANFKPRLDFNRYGGQLGGPVLKNRLFLFANYERHETGQSGTATYCSPTAAGFATLGTLTYNSGNNNFNVYKSFAQPAPTQATAASNPSCPATTITVNATPIPVGSYGFAVPLFQNTDYLTTSADYNVTSRDTLRVRYVYNRTDGTDTAATFQAFFGPTPSRLHLANIAEDHTFTPNLTNEFRIGFNRFFSQTPVPPVPFPGLAAFPNLVFVDLNNVNLGPDANAPQATIQNLYEALETLTWVKGKHTINVGAEGRKYISPQVFVQRLRGDYEYKNLGTYLNDISPDSVGQRNATPPGVSPTYYGDQSSIYAFVNDDYRVAPKLTLNLGLRYEFTSVPASEKLQSLNSAASVAGLISFNQPASQKKNFAPRIGIAYAPNQNTSIRAAFGINYDVLYDNIGTTTAPPQFQVTENVTLSAASPGFLAGGGLPQNATFANLAAQRAATTAYVPDQKLPYSEQWTLGIQHVFHNDYTAEIRYVGTRGVHLDLQDQLNVQSPVTPGNQLPTGFNGATVSANGANTLATLKANNSAGGPYYRVAAYTTAGLTSTITADMPFGGSNYNGLQMQLQRRLQKGLLLNAAYTFSRAMDDSTADFNSTALNPRRVQDFQNIKGDYSVSDLDRRHRLTLVAVYDEPFFKNSNFVLRNALGNWELAPSYTFQSPQLTTVQSVADSNLNNDSASDRVFINPNGVKGTGSGVVPVVSTAIACPAGTTTPGLASGTNTIIASCSANTIGYTEGAFSSTSTATATFTASNAYYVQGGSGTDPSAARNSLPTGRTNNLDLTAVKRISYHERYKFEFAAQAINVLNHSQYLPGSPSQANSVSSTGSRGFDTVTSALFNQKALNFSNNPRTMQLSAKLIF